MMLNSSSVCYCYALFSSCVDPATCAVFKSASEIVFFPQFVCWSVCLPLSRITKNCGSIFFTSDNGGGKCDCRRLFVCLLARFIKTRG